MRVHRKKRKEFNRQATSAKIETILLYGTFGLLMFGPVAFGAVEPWSTFILEAGSALLTGLWLSKQFLDGELTIEWNPLFFPMAGFGFLILAQIVFGASVYLHDTISGAMLYCAYAMLCFLGADSIAQLTGAQDRRHPRPLWFRNRGSRPAARHCSQRQAVLDSPSQHGRRDLRALCEPQPLRGAYGVARAHPSGAVAYTPGRRKRTDGRRRGRGHHGRDDFSFGLARGYARHFR